MHELRQSGGRQSSGSITVLLLDVVRVQAMPQLTRIVGTPGQDGAGVQESGRVRFPRSHDSGGAPCVHALREVRGVEGSAGGGSGG